MTQGGTMASSRAVGARKGRFGVIKTGKFIGTACSHGAWQSVLDHRLQHELREAYGAENARKVLQAIMDTMEEDGSGPSPPANHRTASPTTRPWVSCLRTPDAFPAPGVGAV